MCRWCRVGLGVITSVVALACNHIRSFALDPQDFAVQTSAVVQASPPQINLQWPPGGYATSYRVSRKLIDAQQWDGIANLPGDAVGFVDDNVVLGGAYEYEVQEIQSDGTVAYGYIYAGIQVPFPSSRGRLVLVIDSSVSSALASELERLVQDLTGDGWTVLRHEVDRTAAPADVKGVIRADYNADPVNTKAVFLFGHVPVPYSGNINPDMHPAHVGAWPADVFYGVMDGDWTDATVNSTIAEDPRNYNVPGDGKFDQSDIPGAVVLQVGRVDLYDLPAFAPRTEVDLLRQYLNKNHQYRHRAFGVQRQALLRDNFGEINGDAPATDAWRAYPPLFGPQAIRVVGAGSFFPALASETYLWAYGCGGGEYYQADGVGSTTDFAQQSPKAVFYMLHGSWFGDWDFTDNFLRAALATSGYGLAVAWTGLPHWFFHHMGLGETIGYSTRLTQNNRGLYKNQVDLAAGQVHIALLGDPTLRLHVVAPPANLAAVSPGDGSVQLNWSASPDSIQGYFVYRASSPSGPFARLTRSYLSGTSYTDTGAPPGPKTYMVRAIKLEVSSSGTYFNPSQGIFSTVDSGDGQALPVVAIAAVNPTANQAAALEGDFVVTRAGPTSGALPVSYTIGGTARNGVDYTAISDSVTIPDNADSAWIPIKALAGGASGDQSVVLTLTANPAYVIGNTSSATVTIQNPNRPPVARDFSAFAAAGSPVQIQITDLLANDSDPDPGDQIRLFAVDSASQKGGTVTSNDTTVTYQPAKAFVGIDSFKYTIADSSGATASAAVQVTVAAPIRISPATVPPGGPAIQFEGIVGQSYSIEASLDLRSWDPIATGSFGTNTLARFLDPQPPKTGYRFYRVRWQ